jgi:hypothetical protein
MQSKGKENSLISYVHADHTVCCYCQFKHLQQPQLDIDDLEIAHERANDRIVLLGPQIGLRNS